MLDLYRARSVEYLLFFLFWSALSFTILIADLPVQFGRVMRLLATGFTKRTYSL